MPSIRLAYIILCHKAPDQVVRLIERLRDNETLFVIHVDKRAKHDVMDRLREFASQHSSQVYFSKRHRCYWGTFGIVQATINAIRKLVELQTSFDYAILLSGQDYPIKSNRQIRTFLEDKKGKEFIESFALHQPNKWTDQGGFYNAMYRVRYYTFFFRSRRLHLKLDRKFPLNFVPHGGSQWWCLSKECIAYLDSFIRDNPSFVRYFRRVFIPDETFFQSIISNSRFRESVVSDDLHYIDWENPNPNVPRTLEMNDFISLGATTELFGRKFDVHRSEALLDKIDFELLALTL